MGRRVSFNGVGRGLALPMPDRRVVKDGDTVTVTDAVWVALQNSTARLNGWVLDMGPVHDDADTGIGLSLTLSGYEWTDIDLTDAIGFYGTTNTNGELTGDPTSDDPNVNFAVPNLTLDADTTYHFEIIYNAGPRVGNGYGREQGPSLTVSSLLPSNSADDSYWYFLGTSYIEAQVAAGGIHRGFITVGPGINDWAAARTAGETHVLFYLPHRGKGTVVTGLRMATGAETPAATLDGIPITRRVAGLDVGGDLLRQGDLVLTERDLGFAGVWQDAQGYAGNSFISEDTIPQTTFHTGTGVEPDRGLGNQTLIPNSAAIYPPYGATLGLVAGNTQDTNSAGVQYDMAQVEAAFEANQYGSYHPERQPILKMGFWIGNLGGTNGTGVEARVLLNGTTFWSLPCGAAGSNSPWQYVEVPCGPTDVIKIGQYGKSPTSAASTTKTMIASVQVFVKPEIGVAPPYGVNQLVVRDGQMWRSLVNHNALRPPGPVGPGVAVDYRGNPLSSLWESVLDGRRPGAFTTANRPAATSVTPGTQAYDTTLGKPIWSNGTVWKDATGVTV